MRAHSRAHNLLSPQMASYLTYRNVLVSNSTVNASTLNAGTVQFSTLRVASTVISLGQSTSQTNNFSGGSFTAWVSSLSTTASTAGAGLTRVQRVTMSQSGQYQLAVQSSVSAYSMVKSSDSGVTWQTLTNGANGLPKGAVAYPQATATGNPAYTSVSYSATGQYALASVNGGLLYVSNNATAATPTFTAVGMGTPTIYLPFEGSTADVIGTVSPAANPTPTGTMAYVTGAVGTQALNLVNIAGANGNTATNYIRYTVPTNMTSFTISGRFNSQSLATTGFPTILSMYSQALVLFINPLTLNQLYLNYPTGTGSGQASIFTTTGISLNTWYSFTIIYQIGTVSLYVNNVLIGTGTSTGLGTFTGSTLGLACYDSSTAQPFNGYIDDLRIYNSAITFSPIAPANWSHTAVSATGQYMLAAASGGGLFQSTNFGQTWTQVNALLNGGVWTSLSQSESGQYALATTSAASIQPNLTGLAAYNWTTNGVSWVVSASTTTASYFPYSAFQTAASGGGWPPVTATYNTTTNSSGVYTTIEGIGSIQGDWLQLQSSVPLVMSSYQLGSAGGVLTQFPKVFYILGSNDGTIWYPIQFGTIAAQPTTSNTITIPGTILVNSANVQVIGTSYITTTTYSTTTNSYTYFRILFRANFSSGSTLQLGQWLINFVGGLTYTSNYGQTWSNAANSLFVDSSAVSGDGQYTLGVANQSSSTLGYLPLDNSTAATGSGLTYSSTAGTVPFTTTARIGTHSANFSANTAGGTSANYLNYTVSSALSFPSVLTMAAWIYPTALPASGAACAVALNNNTTSAGGPFIGINPTDNLIRFGVNATGGNMNTYSLAAVTINTWYHVVGVCLNGIATLYVNGVYQSTVGYSGTPSISGGGIITNLFVGANSIGASGSSFAGYVDDVRIYTTALTASAVSLLYATPTLNPIPSSSAYLGNNYLTGLSGSAYTPITLPNLNANINCASCSNTGQYMVVVTQGTTNNVYYSANYGSTWTALTVGSSAMTSCAMSVDGTYITVSNATNVYTLNWNSQGYTLAIGAQAGAVNQASNAIAIGNQAGQTNQTANSIVLNASGAAVNPYTQGFYVAPIQPAISSLAPTFPLLGYGSDNQIVQSATSFSNSQQTVYGEWIQYQLATASPITSYTLQSRLTLAFRYPISWIVAGSNDGTNWTLLDTQTGTVGWGTYTLAQPSASYTYYRIVFTQINIASAGYIDIGGWILNNGSPIFGPSANYTVVSSGLYNTMQYNGATVCITTVSWPNTTSANSLGVAASTYPPSSNPNALFPTSDWWSLNAGNNFISFHIFGFGPVYEYNASGIATQGTTTTINTTVLGNTNMAGTLCLMGSSRVGIGSTQPQYALDVAGTAQVNGTIPAYGQPDSAAVVPNSTFAQTWAALSGLSTSTSWQGCAVSATGQYMTVASQSASITTNIYYSTNYGASWTLATGFLPSVSYQSLSMSGNGQYQIAAIYGTNSVFYLSSTYGATWTASSYNVGPWQRACLSYNGQYQYVTQGTGTGGVYYSNNYGATFTQVIPAASLTWVGICCSSNGQYVTAGSTSGAIYYSSNYGVSYTASSTTGYFNTFACSSSGQYQIGCEYSAQKIFYSNNYGASWTQSSAPSNVNGWYGCTSSASGQYMMACSANGGGVIYFSTNYGVTWAPSGAPALDYRMVSVSQNALYALAINNAGAVYLSTLTNVSLVTNGRVGIGVTSPLANLDVHSTFVSSGIYPGPSIILTTRNPASTYWQLGAIVGYVAAGAGSSTANYPGGLAFQTKSADGASTTAPTTRMVIDANGNVGIGITNPSVPFYVNTLVNANLTAGSWTAYNYNTAGFAGPFSTAQNISAYFSAYASSGLGFLIYSDRRIKKDIEPATNCLDIVMKLHPVTYRKKNIMEDGNELHTGFIAQDVEEVYPSAIKKRTDTIPSIYEIRHAILIENGIQITEPIDVPLDAKVVVIDFSNKKITMIHRPDNVLLFENQSDKIELDGDKVFIFGHEVSDKLMLNHDTLFAVGIGAVQELASQSNSQASQITQLAAENTQLKSAMASLEARLAALEAK